MFADNLAADVAARVAVSVAASAAAAKQTSVQLQKPKSVERSVATLSLRLFSA